MRARAILFAMLAFLASPAMGQETRVAPDGHNPPPATVARLDWMLGQWVGEGIGGARLRELATRQRRDNGRNLRAGNRRGRNHVHRTYVCCGRGGLAGRAAQALQCRSDRMGGEGRHAVLPLLSIDQCAAYFSALTYRCDGDDAMLVAVRMKSDGEEIKELVFRFKRFASRPDDADCPDQNAGQRQSRDIGTDRPRVPEHTAWAKRGRQTAAQPIRRPASLRRRSSWRRRPGRRRSRSRGPNCREWPCPLRHWCLRGGRPAEPRGSRPSPPGRCHWR